jgi:hypothetical protein
MVGPRPRAVMVGPRPRVLLRPPLDKRFSQAVNYVFNGKAKPYLIQAVGKHIHRLDISIAVFWDVASSRFKG